MKRARVLLVALLAVIMLLASTANALAGSIQTTTKDGVPVNQNHFEAKEAVYLIGGPGPQAPSWAAALPDGLYVEQVTDPPGKVLLSELPILYRLFEMKDGLMWRVVPFPAPIKVKGAWYREPLVGLDDNGGFTIGLYPYSNTPNKGGVYKAWATRWEDYRQGEGFFGFIPSFSKTDTFKVRVRSTRYVPPIVRIKKVFDANGNGAWDNGEPEIAGWMVACEDPLGCSNLGPTPLEVIAEPAGTWCFTEVQASGNWVQTGAIVDGVSAGAKPAVNVSVAGVSGETHEVIFLNTCYCCVDFGTKGFWHNKNGLDIIEPAWIAYVNGLAPYAANPFDGLDVGGNPVPEAQGPAGETIAGAGTPLAEISAYLIASNAGGDPKIQLGQQLLAFIFNVKASNAGIMEGPGGNWVSAQSLIDSDVEAWITGDSEANRWAGIFDAYNNNDSVKVLCATPPPFTY